MVCIKTRIYNLFGLSVLNSTFIYSLSAIITTNLSVNPQNRFCSQEFGFLTRLCPPSCLFLTRGGQYGRRRVANITPISCYTVSCGRVQNVQFQWKYLLFKLFCSYSLTWSLAVTCSISILLWVFCSCAYSFYRSNRVGFILNLSLLRRKIILVRWVTLQSQSLSFSGYFPFFLLIFCHTTFCTEITNLIGVCVRFRLQLFAILNLFFWIWFWFLNITIHFTQAVQFYFVYLS